MFNLVRRTQEAVRKASKQAHSSNQASSSQVNSHEALSTVVNIFVDLLRTSWCEDRNDNFFTLDDGAARNLTLQQYLASGAEKRSKLLEVLRAMARADASEVCIFYTSTPYFWRQR